MIWRDFVEKEIIPENGIVLVRDANNTLDEIHWPITQLTLENGVVVKEMVVLEGNHQMESFIGWSTGALVLWTFWDATGYHPENYHQVAVD